MVIVLVGPEEHRFDLHKGLISSRSGFFKAAFMGKFKEADGNLTLPEQDPATFRYFVYWLYTGSLRGLHYPRSIRPTLQDLADGLRTEMARCGVFSVERLKSTNSFRNAWELAQYRDLPFTSLIALYILADALLVQGLGDAVITALIEVYSHNSIGKMGANPFWEFRRMDELDLLKKPTKSINMAWEALPKGSNLCRLLVRLFCDSSVEIGSYCDEEQLHPNFLIAVGEEFRSRWLGDTPTTQWSTTAICYFHEHEGNTCGLSKKCVEDRKRLESR